MHFISGPEARRYNFSAGNEVPVILFGEDGSPTILRDIVSLQGRQKEPISYLIWHPDAMVYPLLFPNGEQDCDVNMKHEGHQTSEPNNVNTHRYYIYPSKQTT